MVLKAVKEFDVSLVNSWVIGDKDSDIELGKNCNMRTIYIRNSRYKYDSVLKPDFTADSLQNLKLFTKKSINFFGNKKFSYDILSFTYIFSNIL